MPIKSVVRMMQVSMSLIKLPTFSFDSHSHKFSKCLQQSSQLVWPCASQASQHPDSVPLPVYARLLSIYRRFAALRCWAHTSRRTRADKVIDHHRLQQLSSIGLRGWPAAPAADYGFLRGCTFYFLFAAIYLTSMTLFSNIIAIVVKITFYVAAVLSLLSLPNISTTSIVLHFSKITQRTPPPPLPVAKCLSLLCTLLTSSYVIPITR